MREAVGGEGDQIESLLGGKAGDDADDGRGGFRIEREAEQQIAAALLLAFERLRRIAGGDEADRWPDSTPRNRRR